MLGLLRLYWLFFKLGLFSFGGGYVMLPLLYQQLEISGLLPLQEFPDVLAISQITPGPIAINAATYVGFRNFGLPGAFIATLGVITPSILLVIIIVAIVNRCKESLLLKSILEGVRPITVGMIFIATIYFLEKSVFRGRVFSGDFLTMKEQFINLPAMLLFIAVLFLSSKLRINPIFLTIASGLLGMLIF